MLLLENKPFTKTSLTESKIPNFNNINFDNTDNDSFEYSNTSAGKHCRSSSFKKLIASPKLNSKFSPCVTLKKSPILKRLNSSKSSHNLPIKISLNSNEMNEGKFRKNESLMKFCRKQTKSKFIVKILY